MLNPPAAQNFALALHEVATNAAKHGALSAPDGIVTVGWTASGYDGNVSLQFSLVREWRPASCATK